MSTSLNRLKGPCHYSFQLLVFAMALLIACTINSNGLCQKDAKEDLNAKEQEIRNELKTLTNHEWAGQYAVTSGYDSADRLVLAPKSGYLRTTTNSTGVDQFVGIAQYTDGCLTLKGNVGSNDKLEDRMLIVDFLGRRFLVPYGKVHSFCLNAGEPYSLMVNYFHRGLGADTKPAYTVISKDAAKNSNMVLPKEFEKYRTLPIITAEVLEVLEKGDCKDCAAKVKLNKGETDLVYPGMYMHSKEGLFELTIESVTPANSIGLISPGAKQEIKPGVEFRSSWPQ